VLAAPSNPDVQYLLGIVTGAESYTLFRRSTPHAIWRTVPGPSLTRILAVDPHAPMTIYGKLATNGRLVRSTDGGEHWDLADAGLAANLLTTNIVVDRRDPMHLYIGTKAGLFESDDGSESWHLRTLASVSLFDFAIASGDGRHWFAAVALSSPPPGVCCPNSEVLESNDGGRTWLPTHFPSPNFNIGQLLVGSGSVFVRNDGQIFRRPEESGHWTLTAAVPQTVYDVVTTPSGGLYAATDFGVYRSRDEGMSWSPAAALAPPFEGIFSLAVLDDASETLLGLGSDVWRSMDQGTSWRRDSAGINFTEVSALTVAADGTVYIGSNGIMSRAPHGTSWQSIDAGLDLLASAIHGDALGVDSLASDPRNPAVVYALVGNPLELAVTSDAGRRWHYLPLPDGLGPGSHVYVSPHDEASLFLAAYGPGLGNAVLLHSRDGGGTWSLSLAGPIAGLAFAPGPPAVVYAWSRGLMKSLDDGATWTATGHGLPGWPSDIDNLLAVDPKRPLTLYAASYVGVYVSNDGGTTFEAMNKGLSSFPDVRGFALDPHGSGTLLLVDRSLVGGGIFRWIPSRQAWEPFDAGLPPSSDPGHLEFDPQHEGLVYLATSSRGVYSTEIQP